jgi:threonine dehydratase
VAAAAKHRKPSIRLVGVVAERAPAYLLSWENARKAEGSGPGADAVIETETCDTIADGLAIRRPLAPNVAAIRELVDEVVAVSEQEMLDAIAWLRDREEVIAEPAGAAATAAFRQSASRRRRSDATSTTVLLVTGCNIAPAPFRDKAQP